jgi:hypothetical protein
MFPPEGPSRLFVVETLLVECAGIETASLVLGMAVDATLGGEVQTAMKPGLLANPLREWIVAGHALFVRDTSGNLVTIRTIASAVQIPMSGRKRSWTDQVGNDVLGGCGKSRKHRDAGHEEEFAPRMSTVSLAW